MNDYHSYAGRSDAELAAVDPLVLNLLVARSIPSQRDLDIGRYATLADDWTAAFRKWLPEVEPHFHQTPSYWKDDINFFRLGALATFVERDLGIEYIEDQRYVTSIKYTDPSDLFLNGVMDTRRGTCGNMAALHVALGWRMGWPVSLACVKSHYILRYDDGAVTHNIEATQSGYGGFKSDPDDYLIAQHNLPPIRLYPK